MRKMSLLGLGLILLVNLLGSCSSQMYRDNNASELETTAEVTKVSENQEVVRREGDEPIKTSEQLEEAPRQFEGFIEDEAISISVRAEIEADKLKYKTLIVFTNKSEKSLDIIADCGLFISSTNFPLNIGDITCPAVESMLLKRNHKETQTITLPKEFLNTDNKLITVRYRQDNIMNNLTIKLQAKE